jgi:hypothetical protein
MMGKDKFVRLSSLIGKKVQLYTAGGDIAGTITEVSEQEVTLAQNNCYTNVFVFVEDITIIGVS